MRETGDVDRWMRWATALRAHPAVMQTFHTWGTRPTMAMQRWTAARARGMISVSTATGGEPEVIDVYQIAHGKGDGYPLWLNHDLSTWGRPTYIRLMAEMNGHWNPYCAFNSDGSSRGTHHSTHWFRQAWRRFELIVQRGQHGEHQPAPEPARTCHRSRPEARTRTASFLPRCRVLRSP